MERSIFYNHLGNMLAKQKIYGEEFFSPKQKELFPGLKRDLIMETEDVARSDDPLEACMERRGYKPTKTQLFQEAIAAKLTADMFGKQEKLTGPEAMFQEQMQECLDKMKNKPKLKFGALQGLIKSKGQMTLFGRALAGRIAMKGYCQQKRNAEPYRYPKPYYTRGDLGKVVTSNIDIIKEQLRDAPFSEIIDLMRKWKLKRNEINEKLNSYKGMYDLFMQRTISDEFIRHELKMGPGELKRQIIQLENDPAFEMFAMLDDLKREREFSTAVEKPIPKVEKMIPESKGQMTLFGKHKNQKAFCTTLAKAISRG